MPGIFAVLITDHNYGIADHVGEIYLETALEYNIDNEDTAPVLRVRPFEECQSRVRNIVRLQAAIIILTSTTTKSAAGL